MILHVERLMVADLPIKADVKFEFSDHAERHELLSEEELNEAISQLIVAKHMIKSAKHHKEGCTQCSAEAIARLGEPHAT